MLGLKINGPKGAVVRALPSYDVTEYLIFNVVFILPSSAKPKPQPQLAKPSA